MKKISKIKVKNSYLLPAETAYVSTVDQYIIDKVNEIIDVINKPVETKQRQKNNE